MNAVTKEKINRGDTLTKAELMDVISTNGSLKDVLNLSNQDLTTLMMVGYELYSQGNTNDSKIIFQGLDALGHDDPFLYTALGTLAARQDSLTEAVDYFTRALDSDPEDLSALTNRAEVYLKLNEYELAAADLKKAVEIDFDESSTLGSRARVLAMVTHELMDSVQQSA